MIYDFHTILYILYMDKLLNETKNQQVNSISNNIYLRIKKKKKN